MHQRSNRFMKPRFLYQPPAAVMAALFANASAAWAHPGHEHPVTPPQSPMHWFVEPSHVMEWMGILCVAFTFYKVRQAWLKDKSDTATEAATEKHPH